MQNSGTLSEVDVSTQTLASVFKRAFYKTTFDEDGDLVIQADGPRVFVGVESKNNQVIKFLSVLRLRDSVPLEKKHALVNTMNDRYMFVRFAIPEANTDRLVADYYIPYDGGISEMQLISAFRLFSRIIPAAIRDYDTDNLVP